MAPVTFLVAVAAGVIYFIQEAVRRAPKPVPSTANLLDLDAPAWDVSSRGSDDESSEVDYDSLPSSCASSRSSSPVRQRRVPTTHVHVHAPAPAPPVRDAFADLALMHALAPRPRPVIVQPAPTIVVQPPPVSAPAPIPVQTPAPAPATAPEVVPAASVSYGKSSTTRETSYANAPVAHGKSATTRETSYEPAVEYSATKAKDDDSCFGWASSSNSSRSSGWSASSSTGKSTTR